jgi:hypothetical protein
LSTFSKWSSCPVLFSSPPVVKIFVNSPRRPNSRNPFSATSAWGGLVAAAAASRKFRCNRLESPLSNTSSDSSSKNSGSLPAKPRKANVCQGLKKHTRVPLLPPGLHLLVNVRAHVHHLELVVFAAEELILVGHVPQVHSQVEVDWGALPQLEDLATLAEHAFLQREERQVKGPHDRYCSPPQDRRATRICK